MREPIHSVYNCMGIENSYIHRKSLHKTWVGEVIRYPK